MNKSATLLLILFLISQNIRSQDRWTKLNGPEGANITSLLARGDTIITGTGFDHGLIFYSTNKGMNWTKANVKIKGRVADFDFTNDGGIIAAAYSSGVKKSFDLENWFNLHHGGSAYEFWSVGVGENDNIYAGSRPGRFIESTDNGNSWYQIGYLNPGVSDLLYFNGDMYLTVNRYIVKKTEPVGNWDTVFTFHINNGFSLTTDNQNTIFAPSYNYFHVSTDYGNTWEQRDTSHFLYSNHLLSCIFNNRLIGACSDDTYSVGNLWGVIVSDDLGYTWRMSNNGLLPKLTAFKLASSGNETYVGTNADGVYRSTDYGDSWTAINNGLYAAEVQGLDFDPQGILYSAAYGSGVSKSTNKGESWLKMNKGFETCYFYDILAYNTDTIFACTYIGLYRSLNGGQTWELLPSFGSAWKTAIYKDNQNRIYVLNSSGIYRSTNAGNNWLRIDNGFSNSSVMDLAFDSSGAIYAGTRGGYIYKTTNDGISWQQKYWYNDINATINGICVTPNNTVFGNAYNNGVIRSTDGGETWTLSQGNSGYYGKWPIETDKFGNVYTTLNSDVIIRSKDNGDTWENITSNGVMLRVRDIIFDEEDNAYLATDESVWRSHYDSITQSTNIIEKVYEYSLSQNYPNPFNPSTTISFSLPKAEYVTLKIYNTLGEEIKTLVNSQLDAGEHKISFDASNVSTGIYFYRIIAGEFTSVKKMQFIK